MLSLVTTAREMLRPYTNAAAVAAAEKYPTTWTFAMCMMSDCYAGTGEERALLQAKARSSSQFNDETALSVNVRTALLEGEVKELGYKAVMKMCELRYAKKKKGSKQQWWERAAGESTHALIQVSQRSAEHINALVNAHDGDVLDALPSLEKLSGTDPARLAELCRENPMVKQGHATLESCLSLENAYYCSITGAIVEMVKKNACSKKKRAFCTFQQSMILPCLHNDCLDPSEKAAVPVRCEESDTAFGRNKEWVCGYRKREKKPGDTKSGGTCDCSKMRRLEAGLVHRAFLGVADWVRKNPWLVAGVAAVILGTAICMAFPACLSMMGVQSSMPVDFGSTMGSASETMGCGKDGVQKLFDMNPKASDMTMEGGGWYQADKLWSRDSTGRLFSTEGGIGGMFSRLGDTVQRGAKIGSRKVVAMADFPLGKPGAKQRAEAIEKAVSVFGDKLYKKPFDPHYFKEATTLLVPTSCANWGQGVDYMKAGVKVAGQFTAALQMAAMVYKMARAVANWYANLGVKSYDSEYETDALFKSGVELVLQRVDGGAGGSAAGCLGVVGGTDIAGSVDCATPEAHWRSETRSTRPAKTAANRADVPDADRMLKLNLAP